jgi:hypothetical protein
LGSSKDCARLIATVVAAAITDNAITGAISINLLIAMTSHAFQEKFGKLNFHVIGDHRRFALIRRRRLTLDAVALPLIQSAWVRSRAQSQIKRAVGPYANPRPYKSREQHHTVLHPHLQKAIAASRKTCDRLLVELSHACGS